MSKFKVNFKLLVALFGLMILAGLIPLGIQALAADEATEPATSAVDPALPVVDPGASESEATPAESAEPEPQNETCKVYWDCNPQYSQMRGKGAETGYFEVEKGTKIETAIENGIGILSINGEIIAKAYPNELSEVYAFSTSTHEDSEIINNNGLYYIIDEDTDFHIKARNYRQYTTGILQGFISTYDKDKEQLVPLENVEVYYAEPRATTYPYYDYTDEFGFFRVMNIPFNMNGCLNGYLEGYVGEYSDVINLDESLPGLHFDVQMEKGVVSNFYSDCSLHVLKFIQRGSSEPTLVEDLILQDDIKKRTLPDGATIHMMEISECAEYGYNNGTLEYKYVFPGATESENITYFIHVEPTEPSDAVYWGYNNNKILDDIVTIGVKDKPVTLNIDDDPYTFYCSQDEMYICKIQQTLTHEKFILNYYLNGEKTFGPAEVNDKVGLYFGGTTSVDKFGNLRCTLEYEPETSNEKNIYEMVLEPVGIENTLIYNFHAKDLDDNDIELTTNPTDKQLKSLSPEYLPAGNVGFGMVEGISQYTLTVKINGELLYDDIPITEDYLGKLYANTEFGVSDDGNLQFEFINTDGYKQEGVINYTVNDGYVANGWNLNEEPVTAGFKVEQGGDYILTANVFASQDPINPENPGILESVTAQTGDSVAMIVAILAGLALACGFVVRRNRKLN